MSADAPLDRIVVGAGLCGLAAAWWARRAGERTALFEAAPRVGGVVRTERVGGYRVERAAGSFPSTAEHLLALHAGLAKAPPIRPPSTEAARQYILTRHGLQALPRTPPAFFASPLLSAGAKLRMLSEMTRGPDHVGRASTMHGFVRRRFGLAVAERFLRPMTLGIYGTRPEDLGLADAFPALDKMDHAGSILRGMGKRKGSAKRSILVFEEGMEAFPKAIAADLGDAVHTGVPVAGLERTGATLRVHGGDGVLGEARAVTLATTAGEQARLVAPLSARAAALLAAVRYVPMIVVAVGLAPKDAARVPKAFGFLKAPGARERILGASFPSCLNPGVAPEGHFLMNVFAGGGADPSAFDLDDDAIRDVVERDLASVLRGPVKPDMVSIYRWPRAIPILAPGHRVRLEDAQRLLAPFRIRLSGSHVTGVGVHSCAAPPTPG